MNATVRATLACSLILGFLFPGLHAAGRPAGKPNPKGLAGEAGRLEQPPEIDGRIEPSAWERAYVIEDFVQYEPQEGAAPSERTVAYVAHD
ncbi:MAG: hypothetical protein FJY79_10840, partial [Candidatus Aminicenantes bacterium]|nr:hypothetical protein [Candidatus Aminicenantes bacterium]